MAGDQDCTCTTEELGHVIADGSAMQQVFTEARKKLSVWYPLLMRVS